MVTLNHPTQGSTNWFTQVDTNWTTLHDALTFGIGSIPFSDGTTLVSNALLSWDNTNIALILGNSPAQSGILRLPNTSFIGLRNSGNTSDIGIGMAGNTLDAGRGASFATNIKWYVSASVGVFVSGAAPIGTGINTTTPRRTLDVLDASNPQLRLTYTDNSVYSDFQVTSSGGLTITPSGSFQIANVNTGFFGATPVAKPTVTGAKGGNTALSSLMSALSSLGLVTDSTT